MLVIPGQGLQTTLLGGNGKTEVQLLQVLASCLWEGMMQLIITMCILAKMEKIGFGRTLLHNGTADV